MSGRDTDHNILRAMYEAYILMTDTVSSAQEKQSV